METRIGLSRSARAGGSSSVCSNWEHQSNTSNCRALVMILGKAPWRCSGSFRSSGNISTCPNLPVERDSGVWRKAAEEGTRAGQTRSVAQVKASEGRNVRFIDSADSTFEFQVRVAEPGRWSRRVQLAPGTPGPKEATHLGTINEQPARELRSPHTGWDVWRSLDVQVEEKSEINTLPFDKREVSAEADCIELGTVEDEPSPVSADTAAVAPQERDESSVLLPPE